MHPEPTLIQPAGSPTVQNERLDRLEQQIAELSRKLTALERQLPEPASPKPREIRSQQPVPPPDIASILPAPTSIANILTASEPPGKPAHARASLENRLGSQVFNRVGIVALLIAATWFLKLAVDNQWIGAIGRVLIGLLAGAGLILWSERFRRKGFPAFSYSLKALGTGVLYLTLWASFRLFHLLPAAVALAAMLLVTAWNAWMAWAQNAELLAAYALAGGLATPLLLSTGGNHEIFLFTYLLAIDLACVILTRLKSWPRLLAVALPTTVAYFIGWYVNFYAPPELGLTALFILLFFATFTAAVFDQRRDAAITALPSRTETIITHIALPIANAAFTSLALYSVLQDSGHHDLLPWLMLLLSAVYLALMRLQQPPVVAAIHLSLAVVFLTIAIPLKANGSWITVGWLIEGVALLWVSTRSSTQAHSSAASEHSNPHTSMPGFVSEEAFSPGRVLCVLASAALLLGFGGVLFDVVVLSPVSLTAFANRPFATALTGLAGFALAIWIAGRSAPVSEHWINGRQIAAGSVFSFNLIALLSVVAQINLLFVSGPQNADAALQRALAVSAFLMFYGAILLAAGFWQRNAFVRWQALLLLVFTIAKTFLYDMRSLSQGYRVLSFLGLGALLMAVSFAYQKDWLALRETTGASHPNRSQETIE